MVTPRNTLVVGATGFLGTELVRRLRAASVPTHSLLFLNRPRRSVPPGEVIESSSSAVSDIQAALGDTRFDCVYHVAAAGVSPGERDPQTLLDGNLGLISSVMMALANHPPRRFIYTGSCAEYSRAEAPQRIPEEHPTLPGNVYGASKAAATIWATALAQKLGIPLVTLRLFHIYGPTEAPSRLVPYLVDCLRNEVRAKLTKGEQYRDALYIDDAVSALLATSAAEALTEPVYNVCSGLPVTVRGLADTAARVLGKSTDFLDFGSLPYRPDEEMWIVGDNRKFLRDTPWFPTVALEDGLAQVVQVRSAPASGR